MHRRTIAGLLAAIVVLLAAHLIVQATRAAEASGETGGGDLCPCEIDNDGMVEITDVAVLATPGSATTSFHARLWSDGLIEEFDPGFPEPVLVWTEVPGGAYSPPPGVIAVSLDGGDTRLIRAWSDGTVESNNRDHDGVPWDPREWVIVAP